MEARHYLSARTIPRRCSFRLAACFQINIRFSGVRSFAKNSPVVYSICKTHSIDSVPLTGQQALWRTFSKRDCCDLLTGSQLIPEPVHSKVSLHKIQIFRTVESDRFIHLPGGLHCFCSMNDHLPEIDILFGLIDTCHG